jgi:uncharacterized repeat protein (TIGR01451 family)
MNVKPRRATRFLARTVAALAMFVCFIAAGNVRALAACDAKIYGIDSGGILYVFTPPSYAAPRPAGNPVLPFGTISRGVYSGKIYIVAGTSANSALSTYDPATGTQTQVGTFTNTSFLFATGFSVTGVGYTLSSTETFSYTDAPTPVITKLGAPQTSSGPAITAFTGGDLAVDLSNNGWVVLSNNSTNLSYLYRVTFGTPTLLTPVAQVSLGGTAYAQADLYSLAFGADGTLYTTSWDNGTLFSINRTTGALTSLGAQQKMEDFASCPFAPQTYLTKSGPTQTAAGELISYTIVAANSASANVTANALALSDPIPAGITIVSVACATAGGATCTGAAFAGQAVTATVGTLPPGGSATLTVNGRNTGLALGTTVNTATMTSQSGNPFTATATTLVVANTLAKTVANITQGTAATATSDTGNPGDTLEFAITYTNMTNAALRTVTLTDQIPANSSYVAASAVCTAVPSGLACTPSGPASGTLTWTISGGTLAPGQTVTVKFRAKIN